MKTSDSNNNQNDLTRAEELSVTKQRERANRSHFTKKDINEKLFNEICLIIFQEKQLAHHNYMQFINYQTRLAMDDNEKNIARIKSEEALFENFNSYNSSTTINSESGNQALPNEIASELALLKKMITDEISRLTEEIKRIDNQIEAINKNLSADKTNLQNELLKLLNDITSKDSNYLNLLNIKLDTHGADTKQLEYNIKLAQWLNAKLAEAMANIQAENTGPLSINQDHKNKIIAELLRDEKIDDFLKSLSSLPQVQQEYIADQLKKNKGNLQEFANKILSSLNNHIVKNEKITELFDKCCNHQRSIQILNHRKSNIQNNINDLEEKLRNINQAAPTNNQRKGITLSDVLEKKAEIANLIAKPTTTHIAASAHNATNTCINSLNQIQEKAKEQLLGNSKATPKISEIKADIQKVTDAHNAALNNGLKDLLADFKSNSANRAVDELENPEPQRPSLR